MTVEECYIALHGDYNDARARLMSDRLISKFALKFPADPSMSELRAAVAAGDKAAALRAVHTLKGVAANLSFTELYNAASALTEQLRDGLHAPDAELFARVEEAYQLVTAVLGRFESDIS